MISDPQLAREVDALRRDIFERISQSTAKIKESCTAEEAAAYTRATGHIVCPIMF